MFSKNYSWDIEKIQRRLDDLEKDHRKLKTKIKELESNSTYLLKTGKKIPYTFMGITSKHDEFKAIPLKEVLVQLLKRIHLKIDYEPAKESTIKFSRG